MDVYELTHIARIMIWLLIACFVCWLLTLLIIGSLVARSQSFYMKCRVTYGLSGLEECYVIGPFKATQVLEDWSLALISRLDEYNSLLNGGLSSVGSLCVQVEAYENPLEDERPTHLTSADDFFDHIKQQFLQPGR